MIIQTDHIVLLRDLGAYAFGPSTPAELADKLQHLQGTAADKVFTAMEILYAFREQLDTEGLTLLGQLTGYALANNWRAPGDPERLSSIHNGVLRDLEGQVFGELVDPDPQTAYRSDTQDWRGMVTPNLDQLKAAKHVAINALRVEKEQGGAPTPFGVVDSDDSSKIKITGAVNMALIAAQNAQAFSVDWTMADNSNVTLDGSMMIQMGVAVGQFVSAVHDYSVTLKGQVDATTTVEELDAIDVTAGWPA